MIILKDVSKVYYTRFGPRTIFKDINLKIARGEKIGILGRNGSGKSTLVRLIGGAESPSKGRIQRSMTVSWPIAFGGAFQGSLTGFDNLKFICRVYGADFNKAVPFVEEFTELGLYLKEPLKTYSSGMKAKLAFAISMSIEFDCYLIDEAMAVGDKRFQDKCRYELFEKRKDRGLIIVSHQSANIKKYCTRGCVIKDGILHDFNTVDGAYQFYNQSQLSAEIPSLP